MSIFALSEVPGYVDIRDSMMRTEKIAFAFPLQAQLGNAKFGMARVECFRNILADGDEVPLPVSPIDGYKYGRDELIYLWTWYHTGDKSNGGRTSAPGNILFLDSRVEQWGSAEPGRVHCSVWYHVQGGQTTETNDGQMTVSTIAQRKRIGLSMADSPIAAGQMNSPQTVWLGSGLPYDERLALSINQRARNSVVNPEVFYLGEFKNDDHLSNMTLPGIAKNIFLTSPVDGYEYDQGKDRVSFIFCWRHTAHAVTGLAGFVDASTSSGKGSFWGTIRRLQFQYNRLPKLLETRATYYRRTVFANSTAVTKDGLMAAFAVGQRGNLQTGGPFLAATFTDQDPNDFEACKGMFDGPMLALAQNIRFGELRKEFPAEPLSVFVVSHGQTVPHQNSQYDGYAHSNADEKFYLWDIWDTANGSGIGTSPGSLPDGALLTIHAYVANDGKGRLDVLYAEPDGETKLANTGRLIAPYFKFRGGNGNPIDPATGAPGVPAAQPGASISRSVYLEGLTSTEPFVVVDAREAWIDPNTVPLWGPYPIEVFADGVADPQRNAKAKVRIVGTSTLESNEVSTGDNDRVSGDVTVGTVPPPPTGDVVIELLVEKDNAGLWTGSARAKLYVGSAPNIND